MPRYEVTRSYMATEVAKVNAKNYDEAYYEAQEQGYWKTYEGGYDEDIIEIVEIEEDDNVS